MVSRRRGMASRYNRKPEVTFATPETTHGSSSSRSQSTQSNDRRNHPDEYLYRKLEALIDKMQAEDTGIPVRNFKSLMSTVPSVFSGSDLIAWLMPNVDVDDVTEALHLANIIAGMGYVFAIDDHVLAVKNDHTFCRFQTPCLYPSRCPEADGADYAVYLSKRTMQNKQRLELADYEAERLARLQSLYCHKWEFIYMQAEAEAKVDKKRDKMERLVLESQERAYWDVHRPVPGCVNTTEMDMRKLCRAKRPKKAPSRPPNFPLASGSGGHLILKSLDGLSAQDRITKLAQCDERSRIKVSKVCENILSSYEQYSEFDLMLCGNSGGGQDSTNPWVSDSLEFWEADRRMREVPLRRVKRWGFSIHELLRDSAGRDEFQRWLEKEFSAENLRFWQSCQDLKGAPLRDLSKRVQEIYEQYLSPTALEPLNVDSRVAEAVRQRMGQSSGTNPNRYCFEEAEEHIFLLMKNDSYYRFLRSEVYKELLAGQKKKSKKRFPSEVRQKLEIE